MRTNWTGVGTAMVTPFTKSGDLDEAAVRRLAAARNPILWYALQRQEPRRDGGTHGPGLSPLRNARQRDHDRHAVVTGGGSSG